MPESIDREGWREIGNEVRAELSRVSASSESGAAKALSYVRHLEAQVEQLTRERDEAYKATRETANFALADAHEAYKEELEEAESRAEQAEAELERVKKAAQEVVDEHMHIYGAMGSHSKMGLLSAALTDKETP
jgi:F0F1-type ATP synthase membrane subunit b/b'